MPSIELFGQIALKKNDLVLVENVNIVFYWLIITQAHVLINGTALKMDLRVEKKELYFCLVLWIYSFNMVNRSPD